MAKIGEELLKLEDGTSLHNMREWVNVHLQRLSDTYGWDNAPKGGRASERVSKCGGRPYLLDWVKRCMKLLAMTREVSRLLMIDL
jgi:hypothetical protein